MRNFESGEYLLLAAVLGNDAANDYVNKVGQSDVATGCYLAKNMSPSREYWENVGFTFDDNDADDVLIKATLPEGWSIRKEETYHNYLVDDKNRDRGYMFY